MPAKTLKNRNLLWNKDILSPHQIKHRIYLLHPPALRVCIYISHMHWISQPAESKRKKIPSLPARNQTPEDTFRWTGKKYRFEPVRITRVKNISIIIIAIRECTTCVHRKKMTKQKMKQYPFWIRKIQQHSQHDTLWISKVQQKHILCARKIQHTNQPTKTGAMSPPNKTQDTFSTHQTTKQKRIIRSYACSRKSNIGTSYLLNRQQSQHTVPSIPAKLNAPNPASWNARLLVNPRKPINLPAFTRQN